MFGILSMPLFINFLPKLEFTAFDPIVSPILAKSLAKPLPDCLFFILAYFFLIQRTLSCVADVGTNLSFFLAGTVSPVFIFVFLDTIFLAFFIEMFIGSCFLLILSYLAVKVVPSGKVTNLGGVLLALFFLSSSLFFIHLFF